MGEPIATPPEFVSSSITGTQAAFASASASAMNTNSSLEDLQSDQQRQVLDTVSQVRKCGLDSLLSLPQIVVCGDQSAGKSSVLEALSEIPFPRNDNLCTRYATEISLRREPINSLTIRIIPDSSRSSEEQEKMKAFTEIITDFSELPFVMEKAQEAMGISESTRAFATDTLSIEICGPGRPQLTLVDIPGLIHSSTKGVSEEDVAMVGKITDHYIEQPRTICLAVISATNDAANQGIIQRIRKVDPQGERTLGVITKLDKLDAGSGSEQAFLTLARNDDVFFKLGWHCIKNRAYSESGFSFDERNQSEYEFFNTSAFSALPKDTVGIDALRVRLSHLLFEHVKKELPRLYRDLQSALEENRAHLQAIGGSRSSVPECRAFLGKLNMELYAISKAALGGNYEHSYFKEGANLVFSITSSPSVARFRAAIQRANFIFDQSFRMNGHKFFIDYDLKGDDEYDSGTDDSDNRQFLFSPASLEVQGNSGKSATILQPPVSLSKKRAIKWVQNALLRSRGSELVGNFNPRLISELFWEQSEKWEKASMLHIEQISRLCHTFLHDLLDKVAPPDVGQRMWSMVVTEALETRLSEAKDELKNLMKDRQADPINYNHYYTDTINKNRTDRTAVNFRDHIAVQMNKWPEYPLNAGKSKEEVDKMIKTAIERWGNASKAEADMEKFSCEDALDSLLAIYKVQRKVFVANIVIQVVERRMIRGLDNIFSPMVAVEMSNAKVEALVTEPVTSKRERIFREDRIRKLEEGQKIFREALSY